RSMRSWVRRQLRQVYESVRPIRIILDPDRIMSDEEIAELSGLGTTAVAIDWLELRRVYEESGRHRPMDEVPLVIVVRSADFREARHLPYDIEQRAEVVRVLLATPPSVRPIVLGLPDDLQEAAIGAATGSDPLGEILRTVWGIQLPADGATEAVEVDTLVRLRTDPTAPAEVFPLLMGRLRSPLARGLAEDPINVPPLQRAWEDWVAHGHDSAWHGLFV